MSSHKVHGAELGFEHEADSSLPQLLYLPWKDLLKAECGSELATVATPRVSKDELGCVSGG